MGTKSRYYSRTIICQYDENDDIKRYTRSELEDIVREQEAVGGTTFYGDYQPSIEHFASVTMVKNDHICVINYTTNSYGYIQKSEYRDEQLDQLLNK